MKSLWKRIGIFRHILSLLSCLFDAKRPTLHEVLELSSGIFRVHWWSCTPRRVLWERLAARYHVSLVLSLCFDFLNVFPWLDASVSVNFCPHLNVFVVHRRYLSPLRTQRLFTVIGCEVYQNVTFYDAWRKLKLLTNTLAFIWSLFQTFFIE